MKTYEIVDEECIPQALLDALGEGRTIQVDTMVGWITIDIQEFMCGNTYRILEEYVD